MQPPTATQFDPLCSLDLQNRLGTQRPTALLLRDLNRYPDAYCTVIPADQHGWGELLVNLPGTTDVGLKSLAAAPAELTNYNSANLLESRSMMCFRGVGVEVRIDLWRLNQRFLANGEERGFGVVFMNENTAYYAEHHFSPGQMSDFVDGLQAQMGCTGPNYNAVRIWGDAMLDEHEGKEDEVEPGVLVPRCLSWTLPENL